MQEKPLNQAELDLLDVIRELHGTSGAFLRSELSVIARGRGLEVGGPLQRLKSLGLVSEYDKKPFILFRLFGAQIKPMLRYHEATHEKYLKALLAAQEPAVILPAGFEPPPIDLAILEQPLPEFNLVEQVEAEILAEVLADPARVEAELEFGPAEPLQASDLEETVAEPEPELEPSAQAGPSLEEPIASSDEAASETAVASEPESQPGDQVEEAEVAEDAAEDVVQKSPEVEAEPEDGLEAHEPSEQDLPVLDMSVHEFFGSTAESTEQPLAQGQGGAKDDGSDLAQSLDPKFLPEFSDAYTDDIGGEASFGMMPGFELDSDMFEGLREMLQVMDLELTLAGETLIQDRLEKGVSPGDALLEVVLFAFAHAAYYDMGSKQPAPSADLMEYTKAVLLEVEKLSQAGEISQAAYEHQGKWIEQLGDNTSDRSELVKELFDDPIAGIAPPALLPEDLRGIETDPDEDQDTSD